MNEMKKNTVVILLTLGVLILSSLACSMGGITLSGNKATVDITLTEDQVNRMIANSTSNTVVDGEELLTDVSKVEFHDGYVRSFGTMRNPAGDEVDGSMDVAFSTADDVLVVEITAVDFPGVTMDDPRIVKANTELARSFTQTVSENNGDVKFLEANVGDDGLHLKIEVKASK